MTAPTAPIVVFPFRYRDARTGRWVKARYKAERNEIAVRYAEWEIIGPGEERRPIGGYFNAGQAGGRVAGTPARCGRRTPPTYRTVTRTAPASILTVLRSLRHRSWTR